MDGRGLLAKLGLDDWLNGLNNVFVVGEGWGFGLKFLRERWVVVLAVVVSGVVSCLFVVFTVLPWSNPTV